MQPGDRLILTKLLGTGTLFAADMRMKAKGRWIDAALTSMVQSNRAAALCLHNDGATACTDVTGFGLLGHLVEMTKPSGVDVELMLDALPFLDGALNIVRWEFSARCSRRMCASGALSAISTFAQDERLPLIFDPQLRADCLPVYPATGPMPVSPN